MNAKQCAICVAAAVLSLGVHAAVAETKVEHQFSPIEWSFQGKPIPETHWSPWLPLGTQQVTRMSFGFRFSSGTIAVKCPVKLTFSYDPAKAKSGCDLAIKVKAEPVSADYKTFESAFGIALPNKLQVGFFGVSGLPSFLPWWDLPWDFWDICGSLPIPEAAGVNIPEMLVSAKNNIGVNTGDKEALPLGSTKAYHDQRDLISFDLKEVVKAHKSDLAVGMYNKISTLLGPDDMDELLTVIAFAKDFTTEEQAVTFLTDACGTAVEKLAGFATLALEGDPYFSVEGVRLRVEARCLIPGGKGSGVYTLYFTSSGQEQTVNFRDITPFVDQGDVLKLVVDRIGYEFRLRQGLAAKVKLSFVPINLDTVEKVVSYTQAEKTFAESDFKLEIPLSKSDDLVQGLRVNPGYVSASVNWASPNVPLKGTVKAYDGDTLVKTVAESEFRNAHNVIVTDLQPKKSYRFAVQCATPTGLMIQAGEKTATTLASCPDRKEVESTTIGATPSEFQEFKLYNSSATPDLTSIRFTWSTNLPATTEILISPSPDLAVNYVACAVKADGSINQGWIARGAEKRIETSHTITVTGLEPGTTYYYNMRSWKHEGDDPTKNPIFGLGKVGQITTTFVAPPEVKVKVQYQNQPVADVPVLVAKAGDASFGLGISTNSGGLTAPITLERGKSYTFSVKDNAYYQDVTSSPLSVAAGATGPLSDIVLNLAPKPSPGGTVYDGQGNPLSGATVKIVGRSGYQATTDGSGRYTFENFSFTGNVSMEVSKTGHVTRQTPGRVQQIGLLRLFSADNCVLPGALANLEITVRKLMGGAVSGATVVIQEGGTQKASLTTDGQGKAVFSYNFNDNNATAHNLTIGVAPRSGSKIIATNAQVGLVGGEQRKLEINCPEDTQGPLIGHIQLVQTGLNILHVTFDTSEAAVTTVRHTRPPSNQSSQLTWTTAYATHGAADVPLTVAGTYKVQVKARDALGNESQSAQVAFSYGGPKPCQPKVVSFDKTSAVISWQKFPWPTEFRGYQFQLSGAGAAVPITAIDTTSRPLNQLQPATNYTVTMQVNLASGQSDAETLRFTTKSDPPRIDGFTVTPSVAGLKQDVRVTATIVDSDSKIAWVALHGENKDKPAFEAKYKDAPTKTVAFDKTLSFGKPGQYTIVLKTTDESGKEIEKSATVTVLQSEVPRIRFAESPASCALGEDVSLTLQLAGDFTLRGPAKCTIAWGDGQSDDATLEAKGPAEGTPLRSKSKAAASGECAASHKYARAGEFTITATLTAEVEKGAVLTSDPLTAKIRVTGDKEEDKPKAEDKEAEDQDMEKPADEKERPDAPSVDLAVVRADVGRDIGVGKAIRIEATVKNDGKTDVAAANVTLTVNGRKVDTQPVDLKAGQTTTLTFMYTPDKPGKYTGRVRILPPKGVRDIDIKNNTMPAVFTVK